MSTATTTWSQFSFEELRAWAGDYHQLHAAAYDPNATKESIIALLANLSPPTVTTMRRHSWQLAERTHQTCWTPERLAILHDLLPRLKEPGVVVRDEEVKWQFVANQVGCSVDQLKRYIRPVVSNKRKTRSEVAEAEQVKKVKLDSPLNILSETAAAQPPSPVLTPLPPARVPVYTYEQMKQKMEQAQCTRLVDATKRAQAVCMKEILAGKRIACFTVVTKGVQESVVLEWLKSMERTLHFAWHDVTGVSEHNFYFDSVDRSGERIVESVY